MVSAPVFAVPPDSVAPDKVNAPESEVARVSALPPVPIAAAVAVTIAPLSE